LNAFCRWLHQEGHHAERLELPLLKLEKRVLVTLTDAQMTALLARKPKEFIANRLHALIAFVLDTGVRVDEALTVRVSNVDYNNTLVTVFGKGRKGRRVPFSFELRKVLYRYERLRAARCPRCELLFPSLGGTAWDQRNALRGLHLLRKSSIFRDSAGTASATPSPRTTSARAATSSASRWSAATHRLRPRSATCIC